MNASWPKMPGLEDTHNMTGKQALCETDSAGVLGQGNWPDRKKPEIVPTSAPATPRRGVKIQ